jgi:Zn-dependent protease
MDWLIQRLFLLMPLMVGLVLHEWAHAYSAYKLGDDTAERMGRLTLDPTAHLDPVGSVLLPLLGIPFGWARPVPVNPARFRRTVTMRAGMAITALAGPLMNLVLGVGFAVLTGLAAAYGDASSNAVRLFATSMMINLSLFSFNLLPIPPLDGSRIADWAMPPALRPLWEQLVQYSGLALIVVIVLLNRLPWTPFDAVSGLGLALANAVASWVGGA